MRFQETARAPQSLPPCLTHHFGDQAEPSRPATLTLPSRPAALERLSNIIQIMSLVTIASLLTLNIFAYA